MWATVPATPNSSVRRESPVFHVVLLTAVAAVSSSPLKPASKSM
jgi:hypothetical protein